MKKINLRQPPELDELVQKRTDGNKSYELTEIRRREAKLLKRARIDRLRIDRFDELWSAAEFIFDWRDWLAGSEIGQRLFRAYGDNIRLKLYVGKYWLGEPTKPTDRVCYGILYLCGNPLKQEGPAFAYEETHKGSTSRSTDIADPKGLISAVHPDFLIEVHRHLLGPDSWGYIMDGLKRCSR
jgi:hypothetical protein